MIVWNFVSNIFGNILSFCYYLTSSYGFALVLFTIFTRLLLFPMEIKQQKSRLKMSRFNAKQSEIRKKYAQDKTKLNQELLKLQEREGNPMLGGCISPLFVLFFIMIVYSLVRTPITSCLHISPDKIKSAADILKQPLSTYLNISPEKISLAAEAIGKEIKDIEIYILQNWENVQPSLVKVFSSEEMTSISNLTKDFTFSIKNTNEVEIYILQNLDMLKSLLSGIFSPEEISAITTLADNFNFCGLSLLPTLSSAMWLVPPLVITSFASSFIIQLFNKDSNSMPGCSKYAMPLVAVIFPFMFMWNIPAAVGFYWVMGNLAMCAQTWLINVFFNQNLLIAKSQAARIALRENQEASLH